MTRPERPKIRISASPITKGGVTIGSTVSTRSVFLKRKPVRVAISAKARPSTVVPAPQHSARNSVFHATPQRPPPDRQRRLQIFAAASRSSSSAGMKAPSPSWKACDRMRRIGQAVKSRIEAATAVMAPATKASPPNAPRNARPIASSDSSATSTTAPPAPMPTCRLSISPNSASSQAAVQPRRPMPKACAANRTRPMAATRTSSVPRRSRVMGGRLRATPRRASAGPAPATIGRAPAPGRRREA